MPVRADPPTWAIQAGLPEPHDDELFEAYLERIGIDPAPLTVELTARTAPLANLRLATYLKRTLPEHYQRWLDAYLSARIKPERRAFLRRWSEWLIP